MTQLLARLGLHWGLLRPLPSAEDHGPLTHGPYGPCPTKVRGLLCGEWRVVLYVSTSCVYGSIKVSTHQPKLPTRTSSCDLHAVHVRACLFVCPIGYGDQLSKSYRRRRLRTQQILPPSKNIRNALELHAMWPCRSRHRTKACTDRATSSNLAVRHPTHSCHNVVS